MWHVSVCVDPGLEDCINILALSGRNYSTQVRKLIGSIGHTVTRLQTHRLTSLEAELKGNRHPKTSGAIDEESCYGASESLGAYLLVMAACSATGLASPSMISTALVKNPCATDLSIQKIGSLTAMRGFPIGRGATRGDLGGKKASVGYVRAFAALPSAAPGGEGSSEGAKNGNVTKKYQEGGDPSRRPQQAGRGARTRSLSPFDVVDTLLPTPMTLRSLLDVVGELDDTYYAPARAARAQRENMASRSSSARTPWDVMEEDEAFFLRLDIPGYSKEQVKVYVEEGNLVIKAEQSEEERADKFSSRNMANVSSRLVLPDNADVENISAELKNGVLVVKVPKRTKQQSGIVDIRVN